MAISNTFTAVGGQTDFEPSFPFLRAGDLVVTVNSVAADFTVPSTGLVRLDDPTANADQVLIQRVTDIDEPIIDWTDASAWQSIDMDRAGLQTLYGLQELTERFEDFTTTINDDDLVLSVPANNARFLYSEGGAWVEKTVAQTQVILGIDEPGDSYVPAPEIPTGGETAWWLISQDDGAGNPEYVISTTANAKQILGINQLESEVNGLEDVPTPVNGSVIYGSGGAWTTLPAPAANSGLAQTLGLGGLVNRTVGTNVTNLVAVVAGGGSGRALPALSGINLTDIAAPGYAHYRSTTTQIVLSSFSSAYADTADTGNPYIEMTEYPSGQLFSTIDAATGFIKLTGGVYKIDATSGLVSGSGEGSIHAQCALSIWNHSDSVLLGIGGKAYVDNQQASNMAANMTATAFITVPTGTTKLIKASIKKIDGAFTSSAEVLYADSTSTTSSTITITKFASL